MNPESNLSKRITITFKIISQTIRTGKTAPVINTYFNNKKGKSTKSLQTRGDVA